MSVAKSNQIAELAFKCTAASNQELLNIIRNNRPNLNDYELLLGSVSDETGDRIIYAMDLDRCEKSGDKEHKFAPGAPKAWREHN